jgi:hypothetical protein
VTRPLVTRRRFLASTVGAAGAIALGALRPWAALVRVVEPTSAARLAALFGHRESARSIGETYLGTDVDRSVDRLVDEVAAGLPDGRSTIRLASAAELQSHLATRIRADFTEGRIVDCRGWILSATEARLYAIVALI